MRTPLFLLPLLLAGSLAAQEMPSVKEQAKRYVDTLAGPDMYGRGYVQGGDSIASQWIAKQFDRIGLEMLNEKRFEPFSYPVNTFPDPIAVTVDGSLLKPGIDYITDPASGPSDGKYELVHLGVNDLALPERKALTMGVVMGHAAVLHFPQTTNADTLGLYSDWESELARAVPVFRIGGEKLTWSVSADHARNAVIELRAGVMSDSARTATIHLQNKFIARHPARNVLGVAKAKGGSKDWLLVTAHYDHLGMMGQALFPGANDNASGVSMLLSLAEWFRKHPPKTNILFVAFAGEEAGLKGSQWFVVDRPMDLGRIKMLINLDLNGTGDDGITVVNATAQKEIYDQIVAINETSKDLPQVKSRGAACNSDHCPFVQKGIPAIFIYTMGGVSYYHDVDDRPETLPLTKFDGLYRTLVTLLSTLK